MLRDEQTSPSPAVRSVHDPSATLPALDAEIESQVAKLAAQPDGGLIIPAGTFTLTHRQVIVLSAAQYRVPTIYYQINPGWVDRRLAQGGV
jgi:hypothetical protein